MYSSTVKNRLSNLETPFYLYDMDLLRRTLAAACDEAGRYAYKIHYALKANFERRIMDEIGKDGMGVDCVSGNEVRYAIECGFPPDSIVYAGVGKSDREIRFSLDAGIFAFNCESRHELEVINSIALETGTIANVALRINPDVDPMTHRHISTGKADNKFGISYKEIEDLHGELSYLKNVNVTGLHFHIGSQIRELRVFEYLCKRANTLYEWFREKGFRFTHINLGGGLGIEYDRPEDEPVPDFAKYFAIFNENLRLDDGIEIHFELGRSLVAQCGEMITRVLFNKVTAGGKNVAIVDSSMTELMRPALYGARHSIANLDGEGRPEHSYIVAGTVCESTDTFATDITIPELRRGDMLTVKSAGAYGTAMANRYNMHDLPPSVYSDDL